jgi:predicted enzyme related to lactoylglutathione lyase
MPRPVHFEISATNPDRVARFYTDVFGWKFQKWDGPMEYWMILTGQEGRGIDGGLMRRQEPAAATVNTVEVASLDETVRAIESRGGKTVAPKMPIPGVGWLAYCQDPEGTTFGVMQPDPAAA